MVYSSIWCVSNQIELVCSVKCFRDHNILKAHCIIYFLFCSDFKCLDIIFILDKLRQSTSHLTSAKTIIQWQISTWWVESSQLPTTVPNNCPHSVLPFIAVHGYGDQVYGYDYLYPRVGYGYQMNINHGYGSDTVLILKNPLGMGWVGNTELFYRFYIPMNYFYDEVFCIHWAS